MDLDGGVDVAGEDLIIVGLLAVAAAELCTQAAIPAPAPLVVLPESSSVQVAITNKRTHIFSY